MDALHLAQTTPRCGAKTRRGTPCQAPAMKNGRCRMHGGKAGAPKGNKNRLIHGHYTAKAIAERRYNTQVLRQLRAILESIG